MIGLVHKMANFDTRPTLFAAFYLVDQANLTFFFHGSKYLAKKKGLDKPKLL